MTRANGRARPDGGARTATAAGSHLLMRLFYLHVIFSLATSADYGVPVEIKLWEQARTPLTQMVDITNEFGLKVLAEHNFLNDNNIAFSPYGLMGILVALYEGVDGESSFQIQRGMHLPWNRNVMRIGFRDIHRTLKTYFVPEEGFLAGLALNNENVTFNDSYKKILRFYGFDLESDQIPTLAPVNETTTVNSTIDQEKGTESTALPMSENTPAREDQPTTPTREETTANPNAETINEVDIRGPIATTMSPTPTGAANAAEMTQPEIETTTLSSTIVYTPEASTNQIIDTTTSTITTLTSTERSTSENADSSPSSTAESVEQTSTIEPITTIAQAVPDEPNVNNEVNVPTTPDVVVATTARESTVAATSTMTTLMSSDALTEISQAIGTELSVSTTETDLSTSTAESTTTSESDLPTSTAEATTVPDSGTTTTDETTLETLERRKKSVVDFIFTNPPYIDDYLVYRSYDVGLELPIPNFDEKMFLANGLRSVQVTYMHYDTILEHAYLPHLEASALRLPLDSERYYLLVVLPTRSGAAELGRLLSRMARESDLSDVYAALRPRRVRAVVPSFTVKGHVTVTTDLQKLGIRDVFEPRQHDFTPMTRQPGVYVRSIEQAVSVAIRKYRPDDQKKNRYVTNRPPVTFTATYPFLYFVMDASIHVSLMAGKMVDPLNTRIL